MNSILAYFAESSSYQSSMLGLYARSQEISVETAKANLNYSYASALASSLSDSNGTFSLVPIQNVSSCAPQNILCRVIVISKKAYLLVVHYENSS